METVFELNDTLYAKALVPPTEEVYLWLGVSAVFSGVLERSKDILVKALSNLILQANVMLSYPMDEASELLGDKLKGAKQKMEDCEEDLDFLREQITVGCLANSLDICAAYTRLLIEPVDTGGCHSTRVQLGYWTAEKRAC